MATFKLTSSTAAWMVAFVAAGTMVATHVGLDRSLGPELSDNSQTNVPSARSVRLVSLGFERFLADMFWLSFVQYLGEDREKGKGYASAADFVNLITQLDPYFLKAYWFGCWAIGDYQQDPQKADAILKYGMEKNPTEWVMPFIAAVNQHLYAGNYQMAAHYYRMAAKLPRAPKYLNQHADILESGIPVIAKKVATLNLLYKTTTDERQKAAVRMQLVGLLLQMYRDAPTATIKNNVAQRLRQLDVDPNHPEY